MAKLQQPNSYLVPRKQWNKWPDIAQRVFNETYITLLENKKLFLHPQQPKPRDEFWVTTAWNTAWVAANAVVTSLDDIVDGVGYLETPKKKKK